MGVENIFSNLPRDIVERASGEIRKIVEDIKKRENISRINDVLDGEFVSVFTDGSNVVSERRGAGVALFSAVSISYIVNQRSYEVIESEIFGPSNALLVMLPRFNLVARANSIMRGLEYLVSLSLADKDADAMFFDGSYITSLLEPRKTARDIYIDIKTLLRDSHGENYRDLMFQLINSIDASLNKYLVKEIKRRKSANSANWFFESYYSLFERILNELTNEFPEILRENLLTIVQNYIILLIEQTFTATALSKLIDVSREKKIPLVWVGKDTESRIISRKYKLLTLATDSVLMDLILEGRDYLRLSKIADLSSISSDKFTIEDVGDIEKMDRSYSIPKSLVSDIYVGYSDYEIVYAKLGSKNHPTIQLTFPKKLLDEDKLSAIMSILYRTSRYGYPEPLRVAHQRCTLREASVRLISDGIYKLCEEKEDVLCSLLRDTGRSLMI